MTYKFFIQLIILVMTTNNIFGQANCKCCTAEHRQFDFWVGKWEVFNKQGVKVGENNIHFIQDSCGIQENWTSPAQTGTSYNYYNPTDKTWNQMYLDNLGTILELKGKFVDGTMTLESKPIKSTKANFYYRNRIRWKVEKDSTISQIWDILTDKDSVIYVAFDGIYKRKTNQTDMAKVTGIGGVFFKSTDPKALKEWYSKNLGLDTDEYGTNFQWYQGSDSTKMGFTQWSPFNEKTKYFAPSEKQFMINYRVTNIEQLVDTLRNNGVTILDSIETFEYGKFVHIMDLEGNKIELWEPVDDIYNKSVKGRTK